MILNIKVNNASDRMTTKIIKIEFEVNISEYEEWCDIQLTEKEIQDIKEFLEEDNITYNVRDFINYSIKEQRLEQKE
jgi:hypothetical protein